MYKFLPVFIVLTALTAACTIAQTPGIYDVQAWVGEQSFDATLELIEREDRLAGRLTVILGRAAHFAIREIARETPSTVAYSIGSPGLRMKTTFRGDSLSGSLTVTGGLEATLEGIRADGRSPSEAMIRQLNVAPFADGIVSTPDMGEIFPSFTPDGSTLYFGAFEDDFAEQTVRMTRLEDDGWIPSLPAPFSGSYSDRSPFVSPDGRQLFIASKRPHPGESKPVSNYDLWVADLNANGAVGRFRLLNEFNSDANDYQLTRTLDGDVVFTSDRDGGFGDQDLYTAGRGPGGANEVANLGESINSPDSEISGYLHPDGLWMIVATAADRSGSYGNDDLYVTYSTESGWSELLNLGPAVNSFANEYGATLSPDGEFLFFTSDRRPPADIYRVSVKALPALQATSGK